MISPDLPITKARDDILNRSSFAKNLAKVLLEYSYSSSFSIGLYGEWGSGKTSLLNMVIEEIADKDSHAVILRFNPWLCSDSKQLISQFFKQLATAIKMKKTAMTKACELIDQYADIFDAAAAIPFVGEAVVAAGKTVAQQAKQHIEKTNDLQAVKNKIVKKLEEENLKIIVAIDDIDRLSKEEIIAVFQLVKALADFPNTVYLLAFDYAVVIQALKEVQHGDGKEYLEKIIQVPFEIPAPSIDTIHKTLFSKLNCIIGDAANNQWDRETWSRLFEFGIKNYIVSIRDVIRYTNVFSLKYELLKEETAPVDLLGLTCLQVFEPTIYSRLPYYKSILCGAITGYSYDDRKAKEGKIRQAIDNLLSEETSASNVEAARQIIAILFPKIQSVLNTSNGMNMWFTSQQSSMINHNVSNESCFERYFSLMLEDDSIPSATIRNLVYSIGEAGVTSGIQKIYREGKIVRLLDEIQAYAREQSSQRIPSERAIIIFRVLSRLFASFHEDDSEPFTVPFAWRFLFCVDALLPLIEEATRYTHIRSTFEDPQVQPAVLALLLQDFETQHGRFTEKPSKESGQIVTLSEVVELEQIFVDRAVEAIDSGKAFEYFGGLRFMWMLEEINGEIPSETKAKMVSEDISLAKVISYCTSHGTVMGQVVSKVWQTDKNTLSKFIDVESAYQRMLGYLESKEFESLPEDLKKDVIAFILSHEKQPSERMIDNQIYEKEIEQKLKSLSNKAT